MKHKLSFYGFNNKGYKGQAIKIETDIHQGFPSFEIIGLPDNVIKESKERIKTALRNCGFKFPNQHILVSLSPSGQPKSGSLLDLPIALSLIFACQFTSQKEETQLINIMAAGELMLDGSVLQDSSALGVIDCADSIKCNLCMVPFSINNNIHKNVFEISNLNQAFLLCGELINSKEIKQYRGKTQERQFSIFNNIIGMNKEKEILTICAAGWHSLLLFGPPGVGKTLISNALAELLPPLSERDSEDVSHIYGCAGINIDKPHISKTRVLSHDCNMLQFTGGINTKAPGEGALSHNGVLILDEVNNFSSKLLNSVKETYDNGYTVSSKSGEIVAYPARFLMVANMNVCPCGNLGNPNGICCCTNQKLHSFWSKIGKPMIDRFEIRMPVIQKDMVSLSMEESKPLSFYSDRILKARELQNKRFSEFSDIKLNGQAHLKSNVAVYVFNKELEMLSHIVSSKNPLDTRSLISTAALARTIADLDGRESVCDDDIHTALSYKKYGLGDYYWKVVN